MNTRAYFDTDATANVAMPSLRPGSGTALTILILIVAAFGIYTLKPPDVVPVTAPADQFSAARAMKHLEVIAAKPHPMGSVEHAAVRDYLLRELNAAGVQAEVQKTTSVNQDARGPIRAGTIENVVAKLQGTANSKALLLVGHYDSVPGAFGASDNGAAIAAMLETLRALRQRPPLNNDVIFLFSDGEEAGLLGAHAFVKNHAWAKDVGLVLNFEARGTGGASIMFETSQGNGWLIDQFAKASPYPIGNSLAYEIYKFLPNDTDMTVFKRAGYAGLNFAYIDGSANYHTALDSLDRIDQRSVQHHGSTLLSLVQRFGALDLTQIRRSDAVYFNIFGSQLLSYSTRWVLPLSGLITVLFAGLFVVGLRKKELAIGGFLLGTLAFIVTLVVAPLVVMLVWKLVTFVLGSGGAPRGQTYHGAVYLIGFVALTVAIFSTLNVLFRKKISRLNLMAGVMFCWLLLLLASSVLVPGASYLFAWPLIFSLIAWGYMMVARTKENSERNIWLVFALGAIPGIFLLSATINQVFTALTLDLIGPVIVLLVLLLGLLVPYFELMTTRPKWSMTMVTGLLSVMFIMVGIFASGAHANSPKQDQMIYGLNADTGEAVWQTFDRAPDQWTSQYLSWRPQYAAVTDFFAPTAVGRFPRASAPALPLESPKITLLNDSTDQGTRTLRLHLGSSRQASAIAFYVDSEAEVVRASINGVPTDSETPFASERRYRWGMQYRALPPEGIELTIDVKASEPLKLRVVDQTSGLPDIPGTSFAARPPHIIPSPNLYGDSTFVRKSFAF